MMILFLFFDDFVIYCLIKLSEFGVQFEFDNLIKSGSPVPFPYLVARYHLPFDKSWRVKEMNAKSRE